MAKQIPQPNIKVLRIGIAQDGKLIQERVLKPDETVTVGESTKNTFVFPPTSLPPRHILFEAKKGKYVLHFTDGMEGRISYNKAVTTLQQLKQGPASKGASGYSLPLDDSTLGKLSIGNVSILFQFVPLPPEPLRRVNRDFRPKFFEPEDTVFLGFFALWAALGIVVSIAVMTMEPPPKKKIEEIPDRFAKVMDIEKPKPKDDKPEEEEKLESEEVEEVNSGETKEVAGEQKPQEQQPNDAPPPPKGGGDDVQAAAKAEQQAAQVVQQSALLTALIGTTGGTSRGAAVNLMEGGDGGLAALEGAIGSGGSVAVADASNSGGVRTGVVGATGAAGIGSSGGATVGGGGGVGGGGPAIKVDGKVSAGQADIVSTSSDGDIQGCINQYRGQIKYCYDGRLRENPNIEGRVEVSFTIAGGRVTTASLFANTTGDAQLGNCIVGRVRGWRCSGVDDAEIIYPFILAK